MYNFTCEGIKIAAVQVCLPDSKQNTFDQIHKTPETQTASDLVFSAATKILAEKSVDKNKIGAVLFFGRTPDYRSPATAIILQGRLGISKNTIAYDSNYGGCGFIAAITVGSSILSSVSEEYALVLVADTISKQDAKTTCNDAGTAILLQKSFGDNLSFAGITCSDYSEAEILQKGGFKKFETNLIKNDGQISYNQDLINAFENRVVNVVDDISEILFPKVNNYILALNPNFTQYTSFEKRGWQIAQNNSLGSTLAIHLAVNNDYVGKTIVVGAVGEGMTAQFMKFPIEDDTFNELVYSDYIFDDAKISHEI